MPIWLALLIVGVLVAVVIGAGIGLTAAASPAPAGAFSGCKPATEIASRQYSGPPATCISTKRGYSATINTTKGKLTVVMLVTNAPVTVNNFIVLAVNGYYTGLPFWRVEDWVVQTGDPTGTGHGGTGYSLPEEATAVDPWVPGSLGMARPVGGPINGGQFFITKTAWPGGDPTIIYNHFATVTIGFDIVQQLTTTDRITGITVTQSGSPTPSVSPSPSASAS